MDIIKLVLFQSQFCYWLRKSEQKKNPSMDPGSQFSDQKILSSCRIENESKGDQSVSRHISEEINGVAQKKPGKVEMVEWTQIISLCSSL